MVCVLIGLLFILALVIRKCGQPSVRRCFLFGYILSTIHLINADYTCLCNNDDFKKEIMKSPITGSGIVFQPITGSVIVFQPITGSGIVGYMGVGICKAQHTVSSRQWLSVLYQHQVGYIQNDTNIHVSKCVGDPRPEDHLTTPTPHATIISTLRTYTTTATKILSSTSYGQKSTISDKTNTSHAQNVTTVQPFTGTLSIKITSSITNVTANPVSSSTNIVTTEGKIQTSTNEAPTTKANVLNNSISVLQGHIEMCPHRLQTLADQSREYIAQYAQNCYELVQTGVSWSHADSNCKHYGGHLIHIASQEEQDFIYTFLEKHPSSTVWLGLHDKNQEENFEWTSGNPVTYINWIPGRKDYTYHNSEDCVFMTTVKGQWDDIQCGGDNALSELFQGIRHAYICQYATVLPPTTVDPLNLDGNTKMCPYSLRQQATRDRGVLGQYDHNCYEIVPNTNVAWQHAEEICHGRGGNLAYISNKQEQAFVQGFLNRYSPNHAVWIGLTDQNSEGHFHWTSGTPVQFTKWVPGHVSNYVSSSQEDCVAFIPYKSGQWDDIPCGSTHHSIFGETSSSGETHPLLCQYPISAGPSLIG